MKRMIALILCLALLPLVAWATDSLPAGYREITRTNTLALLFDESQYAIAVQNLHTGYIFYQCVPEEVLAQEGLTKTIKQNLRSPFTVSYTMLNQNDTTKKDESILAMSPDITYAPIEGGLCITYSMEALFLEIDMEVTLDGDALLITIPAGGIREAVGSKDVVETRMGAITDYMETIKEGFSAIEEDGRLDQKLFRAELKEAKQRFEKVDFIISQITDAIGIEYVVDEMLSAANQLNTALYGGEGKKGLFPAVLGGLNDGQAKADIQALRDALKKQGDTTSLQMSALKKIKVAGVVAIDVMPVFGAGGDGEKGYVFYPDGSGALSYFKAQHPSYNEFYHRKVYSDDEIDLKWEERRDTTGQMRAYLPVFGIKKGSNAFLAAVTAGAAEASINYYPSGYQINLNRACASFEYRRKIRSASIVSFYQGASVAIYDKARSAYDAQVTYFFLDGAKADYSGMANRYRDYLEAECLINTSGVQGEGVPLMLDILTGIKKPLLIFEQFVAMTGFSQVQDMLEDLAGRGAPAQYVNLHGWTGEGYGKYPTSSAPAAGLGGMQGLKQLAQFAKDSGVRLYLQDNYAKTTSLLSSVTGAELAQETDYSVIQKLFSPAAVPGRFRQLTEKLQDIPVAGINFDLIGGFVYYDYNPAHVSQRGDTVASWQSLYQTSQEIFGGAASVQGNLYALQYADVVMNVPSASTQYSYDDESVPFYQMVLHGAVAYAGKPFNTFYDTQKEQLRAIEYGEVPFYRLTWRSALELRDTDYDLVFSSAYEDWAEDIEQTCEALAALSPLADKRMLHHVSSGGLAVIEYAGGYTLYINYRDMPVRYLGVDIPAQQFVLVQDGKELP